MSVLDTIENIRISLEKKVSPGGELMLIDLLYIEVLKTLRNLYQLQVHEFILESNTFHDYAYETYNFLQNVIENKAAFANIRGDMKSNNSMKTFYESYNFVVIMGMAASSYKKEFYSNSEPITLEIKNKIKEIDDKRQLIEMSWKTGNLIADGNLPDEFVKIQKYIKEKLDYMSLLEKYNPLKTQYKYGISTVLKIEQLKKLYNELTGTFIGQETSKDYFVSVFTNKIFPNDFDIQKISWLASIPLFCCLMFGYNSIEFNDKTISFPGIINKNTDNIYKRVLDFFIFPAKAITNKSLSSVASKQVYRNAPKNFTELHNILEEVFNSTV